jgi:NAD(P)-dependent dehydrogenase (short-subunit alcohol dehydrogenase family)
MIKVAIITGAAGGIGQALCNLFATSGYGIVAVDLRRPDRLDREAFFVELDLDRYSSDPEYRGSSDDKLRSAIAGRRLAALINNAAVQILKPTSELNVQDWSITLNVNLVAPFLLTQTFLKDLETDRGAVVNISSIHGSQTKPDFVAYATSKAALNGLTRSLAVDLGGRVRVNSINPAAISTQMLVEGFAGRETALNQMGLLHPVGRIGEAYEVAELALFLASDAARFITGADIALDGGISARLRDPV